MKTQEQIIERIKKKCAKKIRYERELSELSKNRKTPRDEFAILRKRDLILQVEGEILELEWVLI